MKEILNNPSKLIYSRKLHPGNGPKSYGILVCETMDLDNDFIIKAKEIRESMNANANANINIHSNSTEVNNNTINDSNL